MEVFIATANSNVINPKYLTLARETAKFFTSRNFNLVFGGANYSMMGECYNAFAEEGKDIEAFAVEKYEKDLEGLPKAEVKVVSDTLVRFKWMYDLAEVVLILPGGIGTLAEFMSALEEYRSLDKKKLILVYNYEGFYDKILSWLKDYEQEKFISSEVWDYFKIITNHDELKLYVDEYLEEVGYEV